MKEWWNNLLLRDKQFVFLGSVIITIFLIYLIIWSPLNNRVATLRNNVQHNKNLLVWMQAADKQIQAYANIPQANKNAASLLSIVQNEINQSALSKDLTQLHQVENDSVQLSFRDVDFDRLITWLTQLWLQHNITVTHASIKKTDAQGIVSAEIILNNDTG